MSTLYRLLSDWKNLLLRPISFAIFLILILLPTVYNLVSFFEKSRKIDAIKNDFATSKPQFLKIFANKNNEQTFMDLYGDCDHLFCEKYLESLTFLKPQLEQLKFLSKYKLFSTSTPFKQRLEEINPKKNAIRLTQTNQASTNSILETHEKLMQKIELDKADLLNLLLLVEKKRPTQAPHLMITHFDLTKSVALHHSPSYFLDFSFIKKEPIQMKDKK